MKPYRLAKQEFTPKSPLPFVGDHGSLFEKDTGFLQCGVQVLNWDSSATIRSTKEKNDGSPRDVLVSYMNAPVFSEQLCDAITQSISGIEYLPIQVLRSNGQSAGNFFVINVTNKVDALHMEKSNIQRYEEDYFLEERIGSIRFVGNVVLREERIKDLDIFRLSNYLMSIFVSEKFRRIVEDGGFTGAEFFDVDIAQ